jgi:hypothetical protein
MYAENSSLEKRNQMNTSATEDSGWRSLYKVGGVAALIATVMFVGDIIVLITGGALPVSANEWFILFQTNRVAGVLQLYLTDMVGMALLVPLVFALYAALRRTSAVYAALATALTLVGIVLFFAVNFNYSLLYLSDQYAAATSEAQRTQLLAAAESALATGMWGTGYIMAGFFIEGALLMFSVMLLRNSNFSKLLAYLGIVVHGLDFIHYIVFLIVIPLYNTETAAAIGIPLLMIGGTLMLLWYPWIGLRLLQLGRGESQTIPQRTQSEKFA